MWVLNDSFGLKSPSLFLVRSFRRFSLFHIVGDIVLISLIKGVIHWDLSLTFFLLHCFSSVPLPSVCVYTHPTQLMNCYTRYFYDVLFHEVIRYNNYFSWHDLIFNYKVMKQFRSCYEIRANSHGSYAWWEILNRTLHIQMENFKPT